MPDTSLTVLIPWSNRPELQTTVRLNAAALRAMGATLGIVNCGGDPAALRALVSGVDLDLFLLDVATPFNRALALNLGAHHASSHLLFMLDADVLLEPDTLAVLVGEANGRRVVTVAEVNETASAQRRAARQSAFLQDVVRTQFVEFVWRDGKRTKVQVYRGHLAGTRAGSGLVLVSREHFLRVGGFNAEITGWGVEDLDLLTRLQYVCDLEHVQAGEVGHLSHDDSVRDLRGQTREQSNDRNFQTIHRHYMRGQFAGTLEADVAAWSAAITLTSQPSATPP